MLFYSNLNHRSMLLSLCLILPLQQIDAARQRVEFCCKDNQFPFAFRDGHRASGIFVDILDAVEKRMDINLRIRPMQWNECLEDAKLGKNDGVIGAGYTKERGTYLDYPGSEDSPDKPLQIWNTVYSIVTTPSQRFVYQDNPSQIPKPVRIPKGYFIGGLLKGQGLEVAENGKTDQPNLIALTSEKSGSVVMLELLARALSQKKYFKDQLVISEVPYRTTPSYVTFSEKTELPPSFRADFWSSIKDIKADTDLIDGIVDKYIGG